MQVEVVHMQAGSLGVSQQVALPWQVCPYPRCPRSSGVHRSPSGSSRHRCGTLLSQKTACNLVRGGRQSIAGSGRWCSMQQVDSSKRQGPSHGVVLWQARQQAVREQAVKPGSPPGAGNGRRGEM